MQQEGCEFEKKQNFPKADNNLDNLVKKGFSSITFSSPFHIELFIFAFIHLHKH